MSEHTMREALERLLFLEAQRRQQIMVGRDIGVKRFWLDWEKAVNNARAALASSPALPDVEPVAPLNDDALMKLWPYAQFTGSLRDLLDYGQSVQRAVLAAAPQAPAADASRGALDVLAERRRQIEVEGWTAEHDAKHEVGDFERAAATYALYYLGVPGRAKVEGLDADRLWPWDWKWLKPKDRRRDLVRAAALLIAAIDKGDREWAELERQHKERLAAMAAPPAAQEKQ